MENFFLHIDPTIKHSKKTIGNFLRRKMLIDKYSGWFLFSLFTLVSFVLAFAIANYGTILGMMFLVFLITPLLIYFIVVKPEFGIMFYLTLAYTLSWLSRYLIGNFPLGTLMDGMLILFILGMFKMIQKK